MILVDTNDLVRIVTSTAADIHVSADYVDWPADSFTPGHQNTVITSATTTTVVSSPGASVQRQVKSLVIANRHASTANVVTVEHFDNSLSPDVWVGALLPGESVIYDGVRWHKYNADGVELVYEANASPVRWWLRADVNRTLPNDTNLNAIFNAPTNGRFTLPVGVYYFAGLFIVTAMSGTSGNALINIRGAGTATIGSWMWQVNGLDNTTPGTIADDDAAYLQTEATAASAVAAGTGTAMRVEVEGCFECTATGTLIPSIDQVTAAAAVVQAGSYFWVERIGAEGLTHIGPVD